MIKVIKRPHKYLILNMFKNVWATRLVRYIVLNLMQENLPFYLSECSQSATEISTLIVKVQPKSQL
jgi:hypothetical protein